MGIDAQEAGPTDVALLDETIGANLARTVAAHGDREALVARHQAIRWTYTEFAERVDAPRPGADRRSVWSPVTESDCGARTTPSGRCCSSPPPRSA